MNENVFAIEYMYLTRDILSIGKPAGKPGSFSYIKCSFGLNKGESDMECKWHTILFK